MVLRPRPGELALTRRIAPIGIVLALLLGARSAAGPRPDLQPAAIDVALRPVASGFASPILLTNAGDSSGRRFVVEQTGFVRTIQNGAPSGTPFLNVSGRVVYGGERGLLGLAFHPSFETNGKLYVNYTRSGDGATVIDEYRVTSDPNNVDEAATRRQPPGHRPAVLEPQRRHDGLRAGRLPLRRHGRRRLERRSRGTGPEPRHAARQDAPDRRRRPDLVGQGLPHPVDEPVHGCHGRPRRDLGARPAQPLALVVRPDTGDLWIADVGQSRYEEVNRSTASSGGGRGANYGWDVMEGRHCFEPRAAARRAARCSRSSSTRSRCGHGRLLGDRRLRLPRRALPLLRGGYFFADYCSDRIWVVSATAASPATPTLLPITTTDIVSFGQDEDGELYVVSLSGGISQIIERTRYPGTGTR